jgi:hypothetical protein
VLIAIDIVRFGLGSARAIAWKESQMKVAILDDYQVVQRVFSSPARSPGTSAFPAPLCVAPPS